MKNLALKLSFIFCIGLFSKVLYSIGDTLIYIGDPMCSWCYGFSPELDKIKLAFPNTPFEIVMGGLRAGGNEKMIELKDFLREHWQEVQRATGQRFNFSILKNNHVTYDTEPACRAVVLAGSLDPKIKYAYFKSVQESFYVHNNLPNDVDTYVQIAIKHGLDGEKFHKRFINPKAKMEAYENFDLARSLGIESFPALLAKIEDKIYVVSAGYQKGEKLIQLLKNRGLE